MIELLYPPFNPEGVEMLDMSVSNSSATAIDTSPSEALMEVAPTVIEKRPLPLGEVGISVPLKLVDFPRLTVSVFIFLAEAP